MADLVAAAADLLIAARPEQAVDLLEIRAAMVPSEAICAVAVAELTPVVVAVGALGVPRQLSSRAVLES
jgi:hypothetical protein